MEHAGSSDTIEDAERKGLGTPATRAAIIEKLIEKGFIERKKKQILPTADGRNLIRILPEMIKSPKLTAEWENDLTLISRGQKNVEEFLFEIEKMVTKLVSDNGQPVEEYQKLFSDGRKEIGKCPRCDNKETADGYVLDGEIREVDLTYRDQNTSVVTYDEDWQNNRQKAKVTVVKKEKNTDRVLEGGVFALYTKNDILNAEGEVILKADTMIEQKATDQDGRIVFTADLPINGNYYVKEVQAPAGFVTTEETKEFDFAYAGEEVAEVSFEFTYEDEPTTFEITKSDITTGEELPGAKLKVSDSEGNVVDEWTSGSTPHIIKELEVGKKYTLTETIPADGYATAESITFVVENTADIQKVEMQDDTTKILISKVDMTDGSSEVKGAKLYILNENQEVMESWTSGDQPHYVEKLSVGTYTLLEETAPKGYIVANKVTFEVKDTGDVQGAKMEDEQAMGKVILNKTDKDTKKPMKGVEFALCDSKGKVLETLVTDSAGHAESKNYPIATFKNGQYKKAITYILKETKTLDGYQLDETEHKIQFEYVNDHTPVIEYTLDLTNEKVPEKDTPETSEKQEGSTPVSHSSDATSVSNSPKTGDNTNIVIFVLALAVSAGCLGSVVAVRRKRK